MAVIKQDPESLRRELDTKFRPIVLDLQQAGLSPDQIKKELHAAVDRTVSSGGHSESEAARRTETKKTLNDYGKKVGS